MSVSAAVKTSAPSKKRRPGSMPTHRLVFARGKDKESRIYTNLAFLFSTVFAGDAKALGGAEIIPSEEEGAPLEKNSLVKYYVTKNKDGSTVLLKRTKSSEEDEKGKFETVAKLEVKEKEGKPLYVGQVSEEDAFLILPWAPKA